MTELERFQLLLEFGTKAAAEKNLEKLLGILVEGTIQVLEADRCTVFLYEKAAKELWSKVAKGLGAGEIRFPADKGLAGHVFTTGETLNIPDAYQHPRFNPSFDQKTGYRTRTILCMPMRNKDGQATGVFQVLNKKGGPFTKEDENILTILSGQASVAIENAQLYEELKSSQMEMIFHLSNAAEFRDKDTANHLKRMSRYSALIAQEMGFDREYVDMLEAAAPMHDIGKLGVPDAVLLKPGPLTPEERKEMERHTVYGGKILSNSTSKLMKMAEVVALTHQEKYDGTGYPYQLKGEEIPIEGRVVALGDVFDALTSKRCYKPSFSFEKTLDIIKEGRGKHFDPNCVDALFKCLDKVKQVMEEYADRPEGAAIAGVASPAAPSVSPSPQK